MNVHPQRTLRRVLASPLEDSVCVKQKQRRRNTMVPDTSTRENSVLEHRPPLLCEVHHRSATLEEIRAVRRTISFRKVGVDTAVQNLHHIVS